MSGAQPDDRNGDVDGTASGESLGQGIAGQPEVGGRKHRARFNVRNRPLPLAMPTNNACSQTDRRILARCNGVLRLALITISQGIRALLYRTTKRTVYTMLDVWVKRDYS